MERSAQRTAACRVLYFNFILYPPVSIQIYDSLLSLCIRYLYMLFTIDSTQQ
ncbi:hypothetical protein W04_2146 [Pseudoalteromonas sp. SW0106-04]|nr:hypothetical protein W04_2146 [Pseudoalteromonas sp. SW0106-04]